MTGAELAELLADCPTLFHMAELENWPSIQAHGLLSTSALLDLHGIDGPRRDAFEGRRRPAGMTLSPGVTVRDQGPMTDAGLLRCLQDGLAPADWYRLLNGRVFFWLSRARLMKLLGARPYRGRDHMVLEVDAARLVARHRDAIALSPINSGYTGRGAQPRGLATFLPIADYPYAYWRTRRARGERAVELTVTGAVPDIAELMTRASQIQAP